MFQQVYAPVVLPEALRHLDHQLGEELIERLHFVKKTFRNVLLTPNFPCREHLSGLLEGAQIDHEPQHTSYDLIILWGVRWSSAHTSSWIASLQSALDPEGFFCVTGWGAETLQEIKTCMIRADLAGGGVAYQRFPAFAKLSDYAQALKQHGFKDIVADRTAYQIAYPRLCAVMDDLHAVQSYATLEAPRLSYTAVKELAKQWKQIDGNAPKNVTLEWCWLSGWSPFAAQQKPLAPGSAQISLHDIL